MNNDDERDYAEEAANQAHIEEEGRAELAAERATETARLIIAAAKEGGERSARRHLASGDPYSLDRLDKFIAAAEQMGAAPDVAHWKAYRETVERAR